MAGQPINFKKGYSIVHLNARSIRNKTAGIKQELINKDIDIILFSETWLNDDDLDSLYTYPKYNLYRHDRISVYRGGGLCAYVDEGISCSIEKFKLLNLCNENIEVQWLYSVKGNGRKSVICNVYRPPNGSIVSFCDVMKALLLQIEDLDNYDLFILGDFNVNTLVNSIEKNLLYETFDLFNMTQLINEITTTSGTNTCIDLIFTNCQEIASKGPMNIHLSDHLPIHIIRKYEYVKPTYRKFKGRSYRDFVLGDYLQSIENCNWDYFDHCQDPTECWDIFENMLKRMLDVVCPVKEFKVVDKPDPWMSDYLIERITDKNNLLREARNANSIITWRRARDLRNAVNEEVDVARKAYYKNLSEVYFKDSKKFWSVLKEVSPSSKQNSKTINLVNDQGVPIPLDKTSSHINTFFAEIGPKLAEAHNIEYTFNGERCDMEMDFFNFSDEDIITCVRKLDTSKSSAIEYLPTHIFKSSVLYKPARFIKIINLILTSGSIPDSWKIATVTPLPKSGDMTNVSNYRPISVLPVPGKIFERLMHTHLSSHIQTNEILSKNQGGYQKGKSTLDAIGSFVDDVLKNRNSGNISLAAFIDIKKAFDSVNYVILLKKLEQYGIRNRSLSLIENYLSRRQQCTLANGMRSLVQPLTCGVPQGSILGPLFFLLYINDCISADDDHRTMLYADDSVLYVSGKDIDVLTDRLSQALNKFYIWTSRNKLTMNESKTKIMTFASRIKLNRFQKPKIVLNGTTLKSVVSYKYLGVILDEELNFVIHTRNLIKNVRYKSLLLYRIRPFMTKEALLRIYKSHVTPVIDYCDVIYASTSSGILDELQRLQNKCLKTCLFKHILTPTELVHAEAHMPTLEVRRKFHTKIQAKKRSMNIDYLEIPFRPTRFNAAPVLKYSTIKCAAYEKSPGVRMAQLWNSLDMDLRLLEECNRFKALAKDEMNSTIPVWDEN